MSQESLGGSTECLKSEIIQKLIWQSVRGIKWNILTKVNLPKQKSTQDRGMYNVIYQSINL